MTELMHRMFPLQLVGFEQHLATSTHDATIQMFDHTLHTLC